MTIPPHSAFGSPYDDFVENDFGLICTHDLDGVLTWTNPALARLLGRARSDVVGRSLGDFFASRGELVPSLQVVIAEGENQGWCEVVTAQNESRVLQFRSALKTTDDGAQYVLCHAQDVTALLAAERELLITKERLKQVRAATPATLAAVADSTVEGETQLRLGLDLLCVRTTDGRFKQVNSAFTEALGFSSAELMAQPSGEFLHPDDRDATERILRTIPHDGRRVSFEDRWICADGSLKTLSWSARGSSDGKVIYGIARDVTADRARRDQFRSATHLAEEARAAKSQFLTNMSHEIRTPINGIIGMTELTLDTNLTDQQREYLQMVRTSASSLLEVINSILDFSKIEAGKLELEQADFTLWETVMGALKPLALTARNKGVELLYEEGADVPERLRGDPGRLRQALVNLVGNAVKFTDEGTVRVTLTRVETGDERIWLRFEVTDTGIGIPEDMLEHVFGSFNQVDGSMSRRFGGTGLGLAITSGIVNMMGGSIEVASELGRGSSFAFSASFDSPTRVASARAALSGSLAGLRVLAVDDHQASLEILVQSARRSGMDVESAGSGAEALAALESAHARGAPIALALLDCQMPEMSGFELAEQIRQDPRFGGMVLVACTAAGRPGDGARCEELGIESYLLKPLAPAELRDALILTLEKGQHARERRELVTRHSLREARLSLEVLLAEDNRVNQQLATHILQRFGHKVHLVTNGVEVVEATERRHFDVVLMDIQMPEMDGVEATRRIREREAREGRHTPIVAMTAHAMAGDRERFVLAGMDDYISKPISRYELRDVLRGVGSTRPPTPGAEYEPPAGPESSFDRTVLMERTESDFELVRTLVDVFKTDRPQLMADIEAALDADDADALSRAAHTIKGALGVFGAEPARLRAEWLERMATEGSSARGRELYTELEHWVDELERDLSDLVRDLGV